MSERWLCMDCSAWTELTKHGRCEKCGSTAVLSGHSHKPTLFPITDRAQILELQRILAL